MIAFCIAATLLATQTMVAGAAVAAAALAFAGPQLVALMRKHKVTAKTLSQRTGITQKRIREARAEGLDDRQVARDWIQGVTGNDPGENWTVDSVLPPKQPKPKKQRKVKDGLEAEEWPNKLAWNVGWKDNMEMFEVHKPAIRAESGDWLEVHCRSYRPMMFEFDTEEATRWSEKVHGETDPCHAVRVALKQHGWPTPAEDAKQQAEREAEAAAKQAQAEETARSIRDAAAPRHVLLLPPNLAALAKLTASDEHARFGATTGVLVKSTQHGYRVEATDGRRLGIVTGPAEDPADYPTFPALEHAPNGETRAVVPAESWVNAFKQIPKNIGRCKPILNHVAAVLGKDQVTMASTNLEKVNVLQPRQVEGRFPETDRVVSGATSKKPTVTLAVDPKLLEEMLATARAFTDDESKRVIMEVRGPSDPIVVKVRNVQGQEFTGLVMPLTVEEKK